MMADSRFEQARVLRQQGRIESAAALMAQMLDAEPDNVNARYLLAIWFAELGRRPEAQWHLEQVLAADPQRYETAYRLGCILQEDGEFQRAADLFRQVLAITRKDFQDTEIRLRHCESAGGTAIEPRPQFDIHTPQMGNVIIPGPSPLRNIIENSRSAIPGDLIEKINTKMRFFFFSGPIVKLFALAVSVVLIPLIAPTILGRLPADVATVGNQLFSNPRFEEVLWWATIILWLVCIPIALLAIVVLSRANAATLYEYRIDVKSGFANPVEDSIWYYQITEPPTYFGGGWRGRFTHTASLRLHYNDASSSTKKHEVLAFGTPKQVKEVRDYLMSRIPSERFSLRGPLI